mgnify:CR=1 FL=1
MAASAQGFCYNAGRVVSKEELLRDVWAGVIVTDNSLAQCIREIREALGDDRATMVETASRRGYVFAAPVTPATDEGEDAVPTAAMSEGAAVHQVTG